MEHLTEERFVTEAFLTDSLQFLALLVDLNHDKPEFVNSIFELRTYYWGEDESKTDQPNFLYKPTGFSVHWYKNIGRGMCWNRDPKWSTQESLLERKRMFQMCVASVLL